MTLRSGYTTGTCAAAAAKAAVMLLMGGTAPDSVGVVLPDGTGAVIPVASAVMDGSAAEASVIKDAGDDPDITHGLPVRVRACWRDDGMIALKAGEGIGTVTKPGLQVKPGEPAINPVPSSMIMTAVREITGRGVEIAVSIPGGRELAARTFNPRLGIAGGLSILGTTGRVRPFSCSAVRQTIACCLDIASACGIDRPVLVPGHMGEKAARRHFALQQEQVIEVSNEWGFALDRIRESRPACLLILGHPGKLAKLALGCFDTHSSRSGSALPHVLALAAGISGLALGDIPTVEGIFASLGKPEKETLGNALAQEVRASVLARLGASIPVSAALTDMKGNLLGTKGELSPWLT